MQYVHLAFVGHVSKTQKEETIHFIDNKIIGNNKEQQKAFGFREEESSHLASILCKDQNKSKSMYREKSVIYITSQQNFYPE